MPEFLFMDLKTVSLYLGILDLVFNIIILIGSGILFLRSTPKFFVIILVSTVLPIISFYWLNTGMNEVICLQNMYSLFYKS